MKQIAIVLFLFATTMPGLAQPRQDNFRQCARFASLEQVAADRCRLLASQLLDQGNPSRLHPSDRSAALTWRASESLRVEGMVTLPATVRRLIDEALEIDPRNAMALALRGGDRLANGNTIAGLADLHEARRLDPKLSLVPAMLGLAYRHVRDYGRAKAEFDHLIKVGQLKAIALAGRASVFAATKEPERARTDMAAAVAIPAPHENALLHIVIEAIELKFPDLALEAIERNKHIQSAAVSRRKGDILFDQKKYQEASEAYTASLLINPTSAYVFINRARSNAELKRWDEAYLDLDQAEKFEPSNAGVYYYRGRFLRFQNKPRESLAPLDKLVVLRAQFAEAWYMRGESYYRLRRHDDAISDITKAIQLDAKVGAYFLARGRAREDRTSEDFEGYNEALQDYEMAASLSPNLATPLANMISVYGKQYALRPDPALREKALATLDKAVGLEPQSVWLLATRGRLLRRLGECAQAIEVLKTYLEKELSGIFMHTDVAICLLEKKQYKEAEAHLRIYLDKHPNVASEVNNLAWAIVNQGRFAEGLDLAERSIQLNPDSLYALNTRAHAKAGLGDRSGALADHREVIRRGKPGHSAVLESLNALREMGEEP